MFIDRIRNIHPRNWAMHDWFGWLTAIPALVAFYFLMVYEYTNEVVTKTTADGAQSAQFSIGVNAISRDGWPGFIAPVLIAAAIGLIWWLATVMQETWVRFTGLIAAFILGAIAGTWLWNTVTDANFDAASFWRGFATFVVMAFLLIVNLVYYNDCEV